ncbi:MAG: HAD family phosphatase [Patescibacteria group bacterium]|jgi:HAD superfamily hydrolase (TIGR01509 family)
MKKYRGIIFDFNGVLLWDTLWHEAVWKEIIPELAGRIVSAKEWNEHAHARTNQEIFSYLLGRDVSSEAFKLIEMKESKYRAYALSQGKNFKLSPGAVELLNFLADKQVQRTIATNSDITNVKFFFKHLQLKRWFDFAKVVYNNGNLPGKPDPTIYNLAAEKINLSPAECIVVEDAPVGIAAANAAHIGKVIALGPKKNHAALRKIKGVGQVISDLSEIDRKEFFIAKP